MQCPDGLSNRFPVMVGVHQGFALSPVLFILVMDTIMHDLQQNAPWTMLYEDDVMLASITRGKLQQQKTEYLETITTPGTFQINGENLKKVNIF
ncbi:hypothetical protein E2320_010493, partial [Naja naja]